jgi:Inner membrane component of T3SS, cytoplasmic domain
LMGALGALFGLYLYVECVQADSVYVRDTLAGLLIGGSLGVFLNAYGPLRDGAWLKLSRAVTLGAPAAAAGGAIGLVTGELVIGVLQGGLLGRALSWAVLGLGIGLGQGIADRSRDRLVYGLIGGGLGGFLGGFLFEYLRVSLGNRHDLGQAMGMVVLGAGLGLCLALVEQAMRRAWIQVLNGRQEGRIYLLSHPRCRMGLDERAEVGIFGDALVSRRHAEVETAAGSYVLHNLAGAGATRVNGEAVAKSRALRDGDRIELGRTLLVFRQR